MPGYGGRFLALVAMFLLTSVLVGARLAAAPDARGYRHAIAAAPGGGLYAVDGGGRSLQVGPQGGVAVRGHTSGDLPLALAADGNQLLLGTDRGLEWSSDGGRSWRRTGPAGRYPAVMLAGATGLAGAWGGALELTQDGGRTWSALATPGAREFEAIATSAGVWYVATLTSVLVSVDRGEAWSQLPVARVTAMAADAGGVVAGTWRGDVLRLTQDAQPVRLAGLEAGIWALAGPMAGTTAGLRGAPGPALARSEVTALVASGPVFYAGLARGGLYRSNDAGASWSLVQD